MAMKDSLFRMIASEISGGLHREVRAAYGLDYRERSF